MITKNKASAKPTPSYKTRADYGTRIFEISSYTWYFTLRDQLLHLISFSGIRIPSKMLSSN